MKYVSTRDASIIKSKITASEAVCRGLAPDGGLYVPEALPSLTLDEINSLAALPYTERAAHILSLFFDEFSLDELREICRSAYSSASFPDGAAPVVPVYGNLNALELWHGPTCAFKDMALQLMPHLFSACLKKTGEARRALILVATSGDTGKAALEGYRDIPKVSIIVFYPETGVSRVQKLQMMTQEGENVSVCAIKGNFDDAQSGVKRIFADESVQKRLDQNGIFLSSANSINWGRLAPQIVYYFSAYCELLNAKKITLGDTVDVTVPTGNFGNILACYIAKKMGLPIGRLVCASNANNVLTDFLSTGVYDKNREFFITMSPSMDILISSNLERLLYFTAGADVNSKLMSELASNGRYEVSSDIINAIKADFCGYFTDEAQTSETVKRLYCEHGYLSDTHTAVAINAAERFISEHDSNSVMLVCSTASPYKFAADVYRAVSGKDPADSVSALEELSEYTKTNIPTPLKKTLTAEIRFNRTIEASEMIGELPL